MAITNSTIAQAVNDLVDYWDSFNVEYAAWLTGVVGGGPNLDGEYPLTDYLGNVTLTLCPAALEAQVTGVVGSASTYATAAQAAQAAAEAAQTAAELAETNAETAETGSVAAKDAALSAQTAAESARTTSIAQAGVATLNAGYAEEWAITIEDTLVSVAAGGNGTTDYSALHWAAKAAADAIATAADVVSTNADVVLTNADVTYSSEWANKAHGVLVSAAAGGDQVDDYSALHWATEAATFNPALYALLTGAAFTGAVTATNLNVTNWDTAYGWGDHAGTYLPLTGGVVTGNVGITHDGEFMTLKNSNHLYSDVLLNSWIRWQDSAAANIAYIGFGATSHNDFQINHSVANGNIRLGTSGTGAVLMDTDEIQLDRQTYGRVFYTPRAGNFLQLGNDGGGTAALVGSTYTTDAAANSYRAYFAYDCYWDQTTDDWVATRTTLGRKFVVDMGYHTNSFRVRYFNGTVSSPWADSAMTDLMELKAVDNTLHMNGKEAIDAVDTYLRLNQNGDFTSGIYTPNNFRCDGQFVLGAGYPHLTDVGSAYMRVTTPYGYLDIGPQNTSWSHIYTDRSGFYFNKTAFELLGHQVYYNDSTSTNGGNIKFSTASPSGGAAGDIWFKYT